MAGTVVPLRHGAVLEALDGVVAQQLELLCDATGLGLQARSRLRSAYDLLTAESLARPASPPFAGLSRINGSGLPFQWSLCLDHGPAALRFLCETGTPGVPAVRRAGQARAMLGPLCDALGAARPRWIDAALFDLVLPAPADWPAAWESAIWLAVGAHGDAVQAKVYLNLERDGSTERWMRLGQVLLALGREASLARWCALSSRVSQGSWLCGMAVDLRPDGTAGRVKAYLRCDGVGRDWLERSYVAAGWSDALPALDRLLRRLGPGTGGAWPAKAAFVGVEFSAAEELTLKTDLAVCRWFDDDGEIAVRVRRLLAELGLRTDAYDAALDALGLPRPRRAGTRPHHQLVGLGIEADGTRHVNVYLEPPLP